MFTGIVEKIASVQQLIPHGENLHIRLENPFDEGLRIGQSIAHNGVCLTVIETDEKTYTVTAVSETLRRSNLGDLKIGDPVNLERCVKLGDRLDGHIVQGHIDLTAHVENIQEKKGSRLFRFRYAASRHITVEKGSIAVNGVSLTVVDAEKDVFSAAIIPCTYENTNFLYLRPGGRVNVEFDILGKYIARLLDQHPFFQKELACKDPNIL